MAMYAEHKVVESRRLSIPFVTHFLWEIQHVVLQFIYKHSVKNIHITHKTIPGCTTIMNPQFENQNRWNK